MPFDPTLPVNSSKVRAAELRGQFNGLKELIDAIPAGPPGPQGAQGNPGNDGAQGPPFAQAVVDGVTTVDPGNAAAVNVSFDGSAVHFTFVIPRGMPGNDGSSGPQGAQGPPGDVSMGQLSAAIDAAVITMTANSSANSNSVATLDTPMADPDSEMLRQKMNEIILALRR